MRYKLLVFIVTILSFNYCNSQYLYKIPKQTIDPFKILGPRSTEFGYSNNKVPPSMKLDMDAFEISTLITLGQYKEYLKAIKKDSSTKFYLSQMPDTIMCLPENYKAYVSGNSYDNSPVLGITWEAAMNYCRWITVSNNKGPVTFICRLPCESEWLDAYNYLNSSNTKNDFSQNYSDWLLNSFDEDLWSYVNTDSGNHWSTFDGVNLEAKNAPNVLKRKCVIGDSYLFKMVTLADYAEIYGYSYEGYRQIGFRVVKEPIDTINRLNSFGKLQPNIDSELLKIWGLK